MEAGDARGTIRRSVSPVSTRSLTSGQSSQELAASLRKQVLRQFIDDVASVQGSTGSAFAILDFPFALLTWLQAGVILTASTRSGTNELNPVSPAQVTRSFL
jgi:hypothetical protein